MPSLKHRIAFIRNSSPGYLWRLLLRKLGKKTLIREHAGKRIVVAPGGIVLADPPERWMEPLLRKVLPATDGIFVDVGANIGLTLMWLRCVDDQRPWLGFEPSREACESIRGLIRLNDFQNTTLVNAGLSDKSGAATLYAAGGTDSSASMIRDFHGDESERQDREYEVEVLNPGTLMDKELSARVGFVKVDVEGMELEVMRGLTPALERDKPLMIFEVLPVEYDGTERATRIKRRQNELTLFVKSAGYRLAQVRPDATINEVEDHLNDATGYDYLAIPIERIDEIRGLFVR